MGAARWLLRLRAGSIHRSLHKDQIEPAVEFSTDLPEMRHRAETEPLAEVASKSMKER
jgi:hypothetical protein